jgi:hypothetical protein
MNITVWINLDGTHRVEVSGTRDSNRRRVTHVFEKALTVRKTQPTNAKRQSRLILPKIARQSFP